MSISSKNYKFNRDSEAQSAVATLLALNSPVSYSNCNDDLFFESNCRILVEESQNENEVGNSQLTCSNNEDDKHMKNISDVHQYKEYSGDCSLLDIQIAKCAAPISGAFENLIETQLLNEDFVECELCVANSKACVHIANNHTDGLPVNESVHEDDTSNENEDTFENVDIKGCTKFNACTNVDNHKSNNINEELENKILSGCVHSTDNEDTNKEAGINCEKSILHLNNTDFQIEDKAAICDRNVNLRFEGNHSSKYEINKLYINSELKKEILHDITRSMVKCLGPSNENTSSLQKHQSRDDSNNILSAEIVKLLECKTEEIRSDFNKQNISQEQTTNVEVDNSFHLNEEIEYKVVENPLENNELPVARATLTHWQLNRIGLPPFIPHVAPPPWLRPTIPADGYRCRPCGDTSLIQHIERRSVWIKLECGPCDLELTFYNRCSLKGHLESHIEKGETIDEETVEIHVLPLHLARLLQPIVVPVPKILKVTTDEESAKTDTEDRLSNSASPSLENILSVKKRTVRCFLCERMFFTSRELIAHMHTDQPWSSHRVECKKCQLILPSVCAAKAHVLTHPPATQNKISVCPECGSCCNSPREFVHHLNTCGHQFRRSGILCPQCSVCFFRLEEDFLYHWIKEHCKMSYRCAGCSNTFKSCTFHKCTLPKQQLLSSFKCYLECSICSEMEHIQTKDDKEVCINVKNHLLSVHPLILSRVCYVFKSKFCSNAFLSKDCLHLHHDQEHKKDNYNKSKGCSLQQEVEKLLHRYFNGIEPRNAFVSVKYSINKELPLEETKLLSTDSDKCTLFMSFDDSHGDETTELLCASTVQESNKLKALNATNGATKNSSALIHSLQPTVCYQCGLIYDDIKVFRKHMKSCDTRNVTRICSVCSMSLISAQFAVHCRSHIREGIILCIFCSGQKFCTKKALELHFELHIHEQFLYPFTCIFCGTTVTDVHSALNHILEEHNVINLLKDSNTVACSYCGRAFHGERGLNVHLTKCPMSSSLTIPQGSGRQCKLCGKVITLEVFGKHMISHLEDGLLFCILCDGKALPSSMALLHHLEEHMLILSYPFQCPVCLVMFPDKLKSLTHLKEEHGFGNVKCSMCEMTYNFTYQLIRHTEIVHKVCPYAKRRYICWICKAYDHVKKDSLLSHFCTAHQLSREEVDEKVMIRTRGQGTMPTLNFVPTKPLGSKESLDLASEANDECNLPDISQLTSISKHSSTKGESEKHVIVKKMCKGNSNSASSPTVCDSVYSKNLSRDLFQKNAKIIIKKLPSNIAANNSYGVSEHSFQHKLEKVHRKKEKRKVFICSICKYDTSSCKKYERHKLKCIQSNSKKVKLDNFVCSVCDQSFVVELSLLRHMFFEHKIKFQPTEEDPKSKMKKGVKNVKKETLLCKICKENFVKVNEYYKHLKTHGMAFLKLGRKKRKRI